MDRYTIRHRKINFVMFIAALSVLTYLAIITINTKNEIDTEIQNQIKLRYFENIGYPASKYDEDIMNYIIYGIKPDTIEIK